MSGVNDLKAIHFLNLLIVVIFALFGGFLLKLIHGIEKVYWPFNHFIKKVKPLITIFKIPTLLG